MAPADFSTDRIASETRQLSRRARTEDTTGFPSDRLFAVALVVIVAALVAIMLALWL